jgi:hypothetical protein
MNSGPHEARYLITMLGLTESKFMKEAYRSEEKSGGVCFTSVPAILWDTSLLYVEPNFGGLCVPWVLHEQSLMLCQIHSTGFEQGKYIWKVVSAKPMDSEYWQNRKRFMRIA